MTVSDSDYMLLNVIFDQNGVTVAFFKKNVYLKTLHYVIIWVENKLCQYGIIHLVHTQSFPKN